MDADDLVGCRRIVAKEEKTMDRKSNEIGRRTLLVGSSAVATGAVVGTVIAGDSVTEANCDVEVDLIAGRTIPSGIVCVIVDSPNFFVTYSTSGDWKLTETNLAVGDDLDVYQDERWINPRGHPRPGQFPYKKRHEPSVDEYTLAVPFQDVEPFESPVVIAAHAVVERMVDGEPQEETAWGDGERFVERGSWGMYFEVDAGEVTFTGVGETAAGGI